MALRAYASRSTAIRYWCDGGGRVRWQGAAGLAIVAVYAFCALLSAWGAMSGDIGLVLVGVVVLAIAVQAIEGY
jgi:hypothetical protein